MQTEILKNSVLGEKVTKATLENGLTVLICEKREFSSSFAIFGTRYGSIDTKFEIGGENITVPEGIAHFLEHKLFENEDCDAFARFAKTGANANAYTSFDRTCYLFSCSDKFYENLDILLDFVRAPYFTAETVQKEQGIIGQEIRMYDDVPEWCVFFNLIKALYATHPVRVDIAGTVDSIAEITDKLLYDCYNTFYSMNNMFLCIAGNIDTEKTLKRIDETLKNDQPKEFKTTEINEPEKVNLPLIEKQMEVAIPLFSFGIKLPAQKNTTKQVLIREIALDLLVGSSSDCYAELLNSGLINKTFETEYFFGRGYSALLFQGQSANPQAVVERLKKEIGVLKQKIDLNLFDGIKKDTVGKSIAEWDNPEDIVSGLVDCVFLEGNPFGELDALEQIGVEDIYEFFRSIEVENSSLSVINQKN